MFRVVTSNRWEALVAALLARCDEAHRSPLEPLQLIVPSLALRRDLTMRIAAHHGVCANVEFHFLAQWLWRSMAAVVPGVARETPFDADTLAWRLDALFADQRFAGRHPRLAPYLEACEHDAAMRFEFALRCAQVFEHYTTYRADWLDRWAQGRAVDPPSALAPGSPDHEAWIDNEAWQRAIWQRLLQALDMPGEHPGHRFLKTLREDPSAARMHLPKAIHVMALPAVPALHLQWLQALARVIDVHLYVVNPSQAYWVDVADERRLAWMRRARPMLALHREAGHPLLAAWGRQAQAQHALLLHHMDDDAEETEAFVEPQGHARLARMQRAILHLDDAAPLRRPERSDAAAHGKEDAGLDPPRQAHDRSVEIHVAHSLRRELEALHERLLAHFAEPGAPRAHEVLVVTPDIDEAAPMIEAVFGAARGERRIAYAITGRAHGDDGGAAAALMQLLDAGSSRWTAGTLMALAQTPMVAQRMGWSGEDLETLRDWIDTAGMRFGLDAEHRAALELPPSDAHTLDDALDRLLLGHVFAEADDDDTSLAQGVALGGLAGKLPAGHATGSLAPLLGSLASLQGRLQAWRRHLSMAHTGANWHALLLGAIDDFLLATTELEREGLRALRLALSQWHARLRAAHEQRDLPLALLRLSLQKALEARAQGAVPGGALTFASMTGLRQLPYRVIVAVGLNDGSWGLAPKAPSFDLMAMAPRPGDRQRRLDERNVLMDLMLAARDRFWIFYTGRGQRDNAERPPAAVVDEWIDALARADGISREAMRQAIVVEHPLQPFSSALYASEAPPWRRSHHAGYAQGLRRRGDGASTAPADAGLVDETADDAEDTAESAFDDADAPLIDVALAPWPEGRRRITLDELKAFFANPARDFLKRRLGIQLPGDEEALREDESFEVSPLDRSTIARQLMPALRAGADDTLLARHAQASGCWPEGGVGDRLLASDLEALRSQARALQDVTDAPSHAGEGATQPQPVEALRLTAELHVDDPEGSWQLVVDIDDVYPNGLALWRASQIRPKHLLAAWIEHLALGALLDAEPGRAPAIRAQTLLVGRDAQPLHFMPVPDARACLGALVTLMSRGLREPLPFMPEMSWKLADGSTSPSDDDDETDDMDADASRRGPGGRPESEDPWRRLAWRGRSMPRGPRLDVARQVYAPLKSSCPAATDALRPRKKKPKKGAS